MKNSAKYTKVIEDDWKKIEFENVMLLSKCTRFFGSQQCQKGSQLLQNLLII